MSIQIQDKFFEPYLSEITLQKAVHKIADRILEDYKDTVPVFLGVLNGSFMFCADLLKAYSGECEISFIKLASYQKTKSTGNVNELIGLNQDLKNRRVIVLEDIIDTGTTIEKIVSILKEKEVTDYKIASLFFKKEVYKKEIPIDYVGIEIPNKFIVGYGLDYDGLGRNLKEVYQLEG